MRMLKFYDDAFFCEDILTEGKSLRIVAHGSKDHDMIKINNKFYAPEFFAQFIRYNLTVNIEEIRSINIIACFSAVNGMAKKLSKHFKNTYVIGYKNNVEYQGDTPESITKIINGIIEKLPQHLSPERIRTIAIEKANKSVSEFGITDGEKTTFLNGKEFFSGGRERSCLPRCFISH